MQVALLVLATLLFVVLSPGAFVKLPSAGSSKFVALVVHAIIFVLILKFAGDSMVSYLATVPGLEGYRSRKDDRHYIDECIKRCTDEYKRRDKDEQIHHGKSRY
jgi:hypothetical protein